MLLQVNRVLDSGGRVLGSGRRGAAGSGGWGTGLRWTGCLHGSTLSSRVRSLQTTNSCGGRSCLSCHMPFAQWVWLSRLVDLYMYPNLPLTINLPLALHSRIGHCMCSYIKVLNFGTGHDICRGLIHAHKKIHIYWKHQMF